MSRSTSNLGSPATPALNDKDAFNFDPAHLQAWLLPQELWDSLPPALKSSVTDVQHSAAAVLTSKYNFLEPRSFSLPWLRLSN